jgi:uncharacterized membrane protein
MNTIHLHLLLNHLPVVGSVFAVLLLALALVRRSAELARVSFGFLTLLGAAALIVYLTGEPALDAIEKLPGFSEGIADRHEDAALVATIVTGTVGALALGALLVYRRRGVPRWLTTLGFIAALGSTAIMGYTANLGGQIRHTEIRPGSTTGTAGALRPSDVDRER